MPEHNTDRAAHRRAVLEEARRAERRSTLRRRALLTIGGLAAASIATGLVIAAVHDPAPATATASTSSESIPAALIGATTTQKKPTVVKDTSGITGVTAWASAIQGKTAPKGALEANHVDGPVSYAVTPPVGGPHNAVWLNAGVYDKAVPNEHAVHDMEHGAVWITYRPGLPAAEVSALRATVAKQKPIDEGNGSSNRYMLLSPWADDSLPAPIVVTAWGHQLRLDSADDPRLEKFIAAFRHNAATTPELGAPVDGAPAAEGGTPLPGTGAVK